MVDGFYYFVIGISVIIIIAVIITTSIYTKSESFISKKIKHEKIYDSHELNKINIYNSQNSKSSAFFIIVFGSYKSLSSTEKMIQFSFNFDGEIFTQRAPMYKFRVIIDENIDIPKIKIYSDWCLFGILHDDDFYDKIDYISVFCKSEHWNNMTSKDDKKWEKILIRLVKKGKGINKDQ